MFPGKLETENGIVEFYYKEQGQYWVVRSEIVGKSGGVSGYSLPYSRFCDGLISNFNSQCEILKMRGLNV